MTWENGDVVTFDHVHKRTDGSGRTYTERHVAIRRDYNWKDGQWQVAIHGFWRVPDEFIDAKIAEGIGWPMRRTETVAAQRHDDPQPEQPAGSNQGKGTPTHGS